MTKAVITGDIIQSTKMSMADRKMLIDAIDDGLKKWGSDFNMQTEIYRGDSFQCLLKAPEYGLRVALIIKTFIKSLNPSEAYELTPKSNPSKKKDMVYPVWMFDSRIALGIGKTEENIKRLGKANGEAFQLSGHLLDDLKTSKRTFGIISNDDNDVELETESVLLDFILSRTTALQCEVINFKLLGYTETQIAHQLDIAQSAVNQRSNAAGWNAVDTLLNRFEMIYQ
jgi:hypothetical protein